MRYTILLTVLVAVFVAPAFGAGTYYIVDEDWEAAGAWTPAAPPTGWWTTYSNTPDDNDWHGDTGITGSYGAFVNDFPHETTPENDWLNTDAMDLSSVVPSEGDTLYVEYDLALDWWNGAQTGTYFRTYLYIGGYGSYTLDYIPVSATDAVGTYYTDITSAAAGYSSVYLTFQQYMTDSWAINSLIVDDVSVVWENVDPVAIKSASLGEIKALYRDQ